MVAEERRGDEINVEMTRTNLPHSLLHSIDKQVTTRTTTTRTFTFIPVLHCRHPQMNEETILAPSSLACSAQIAVKHGHKYARPLFSRSAVRTLIDATNTAGYDGEIQKHAWAQQVPGEKQAGMMEKVSRLMQSLVGSPNKRVERTTFLFRQTGAIGSLQRGKFARGSVEVRLIETGVDVCVELIV